jgi:DNA-binding NarL/FixJ family response regulator
MKVLIADDHPIFRQGLLKIIGADPAFEIVAEIGDGFEALAAIKKMRPDVAVLDISMPQMNGLEIARRVQQENLPVHLVILTMYKEEEYFDEAMEAGVKGYLLKENAVADLRNCLQAVAAGKYYVSPVISGYLINRNARQKALAGEKPSLRLLTDTERRILKLLVQNKTSREIAAQLHVSYRTVQNHRANICQKLGLKGYNKLLGFALQNKSSL